jgi:predicted deacylase
MSSLQGYSLPLLDSLAEEFQLIKNSSLSGVAGVMLFDSGLPGPRIGITIHTHGNEPCGMAALRFFRQRKLGEKLLKGSVAFVLNNLKATEEYFKLCQEQSSPKVEELKLKTRFKDVNMNRLPESTMQMNDDGKYEIIRAKELRPVWSSFEYALDIHSTRNQSPPMIIAIGDTDWRVYAGCPIEIILRDIDKIQTGKPACAFYGGFGAKVFGIEGGGPHEDPRCFEVAIESMLALLRNVGMIEPSESLIPNQNAVKQVEYKIIGSVFFPNESYELVRPFKNFEPCYAGQLLATGNGEAITIPSDGHVIFTPPGIKPTSGLTDEVLFLSAPAR